MTKEATPDIHQDAFSKTVFGFWVYLMTDFMVFACLFATYWVLKDSTFGGPTAKELFDLPHAFAASIILLLATFTAGVGSLMAHRKKKHPTIVFFLVTLALGFLFLYFQIEEFRMLITSGNSWTQSAFLSAYFTLVGTHALHVIFALLWVPVLLIPVWVEGVSFLSKKRLTCLKLFWQFLNLVWVFIFAIVYLWGEL